MVVNHSFRWCTPLQLRGLDGVAPKDTKREEFKMNVSEQTFDWIFFAIVCLPSIYLVFDWYKNR
jgi:23S rRNA pseudoU1915 N3-methylase RlmH